MFLPFLHRRAPTKMLNVQFGQAVEVKVAQKLDEDYKAPPTVVKPFQGAGHKLGGLVFRLDGFADFSQPKANVQTFVSLSESLLPDPMTLHLRQSPQRGTRRGSSSWTTQNPSPHFKSGSPTEQSDFQCCLLSDFLARVNLTRACLCSPGSSPSSTTRTRLATFVRSSRRESLPT